MTSNPIIIIESDDCDEPLTDLEIAQLATMIPQILASAALAQND